MSNFTETTSYEAEVLAGRMEQGEFFPAAIHRYKISTLPTMPLTAVVHEETNDDNDDGFPDGKWETWNFKYPSVEAALKHCGKCRVGFSSGVIVTVTLDGKEVR